MNDIEEQIKDPYINTDISLLISSKCYEDFYSLYNNLIINFGNKENVEILVKVDGISDRYYQLLDDNNFKFKILSYPCYNKRISNHIFFNDLCKISNGNLIWSLYEDCKIVKGDWYKSLMKFIDNNFYDDNIFNIAIPMDNGKGYKQICGANIISREWYDFFKIVSPFPNLDRWLSELSRKIGRYFYFKEEELLSSFPKGHRTLSKQQRKDLFYPLLEGNIKKFKEMKNEM